MISSSKLQEHLNNKDIDNLKRLIWICSTGLPEQDQWVSTIWLRLRAKAGVATGDFEVRHIPLLEAEIRRILACSEMTRAVSERVANTMLCSHVAGNSSIDQGCVLRIGEDISKFEYSTSAAYDDWHEHDIKCFVERIEVDHPTPYNVDEPEY